MAADTATNCTLGTGYDNTLKYINHIDGSVKTRLSKEKNYASIDKTSTVFEESGGGANRPAGCNFKQGGCFGNSGRNKEGLMEKQLWQFSDNKQGWKVFTQQDKVETVDNCSTEWVLTTTTTQGMSILEWQERKEAPYQHMTEIDESIKIATLPDPPPKPPWPPPWITVAWENSSRKNFTFTKSSDRAQDGQLAFQFRRSHSFWGEGSLPPHNNVTSGYSYTTMATSYGGSIVAPANGTSSDRKFRLPPPPWLSHQVPEQSRVRQGFRQKCQCQSCTAYFADCERSLTSHNPTKIQVNMVNNEDTGAPGGATGKRGLDDGSEKEPDANVVSPTLQRRKTGEEDPMDIEEVVQPQSRFDKAVEKQAKQPAASSLKKASKKGEKTKQTSFAAAVSGGQEELTESIKIEVEALRTQGKSLVEDHSGTMKTVLKVFTSVLGSGKVCVKAVEDNNDEVFTGNAKGLDDYQLAEKFVASEPMWESKQKVDEDGNEDDMEADDYEGMDELFKVKAGSKKEWMKLVLVLGHSGIKRTKLGSIRSKLSEKNIRLSIKTTPGLYSNSNVVLLQGATRLPLAGVTKLLKAALAAAISKKEGCFAAPPLISVELTYPPGLFSKDPFIKNAANKKVLVVTYSRLDEERIIAILTEWKNQCREKIGRFCYFHLIPDMKDPNVPEVKKEAWKGRASMHALMNEVLVHFSLVGFRNPPYGLDKTVKLQKTDGSSVVTTARKILMGLQLPAKKKGKPRFALVAACQTSDGVEVVFPNSLDVRQLFENMAVCPAAWFLYHWLIDLQITKKSMLEQIQAIFDPEYIKMATNCVEREVDGTLFVTYDNGGDAIHAEAEELKDVEWMKAAIEAVQLNQSNSEAAMENGRLYDFDEESSLGSVTTTGFIKKRYGESVLEMADARNAATAAASQAKAASSETPPSDDGVVGSQV